MAFVERGLAAFFPAFSSLRGARTLEKKKSLIMHVNPQECDMYMCSVSSKALVFKNVIIFAAVVWVSTVQIEMHHLWCNLLCHGISQ